MPVMVPRVLTPTHRGQPLTLKIPEDQGLSRFPAGILPATMNAMSAFAETISRMWDTRPSRIPSDQGGNAKVAGVCEGIGVRYQVDPTLVRIAFVVTSLAIGGGLAAYLLAWMCMPRYGLSTSPVQAVIRNKGELDEREIVERSTGWWLIIGFVFLSGIFTLGDWDNFGSTAFLAIGLLLLAWYGLHRRLPEPPLRHIDLSAYTSMNPLPAPPAWDPLGTAPFAWHLPEPPSEPAPKKKARVWTWVLGGFGITLLVTALVGAAATTFGYVYSSGETRVAPTEESQLQELYTGDIGEITYDFSQLPPLESPRATELEHGIGTLTVIVPDSPYRLLCDDILGESNCVDGLYNEGAEGELLTLEISGGIGEIKIHN